MKATRRRRPAADRRLPNQLKPEVLAGLPQMPQVRVQKQLLSRTSYRKQDAVLQLVTTKRNRIPLASEFKARRARLRAGRKDPVVVTMLGGCNAVQVQVDHRRPFECLSSLRKAIDLAELKPGGRLAIDLRCPGGIRKLSRSAAYAAAVHAARMPGFGSKAAEQEAPSQIILHGYHGLGNVRHAIAAAEANTLCRQLCVLPGNVLTAERFIGIAEEAARIHGLEHELLDRHRLAEMGANLFLAVSGDHGGAGLVRLSHRCGREGAKRIALLGKGVCFDTGGINVKPHQHMLGMQGDMAGAAAALGAVIAAKRLNLNLDVDAWLAVAENLISADAMRPGDAITSHSGRTVEIVHTDAEGRMLLADGLSILSGTKPDLVVTLATLTGSMIAAVGSHMSGVTGTGSEVEQACRIGEACGERLVPFPLAEDYMPSLSSKVADILQCSAGREPDHILAGLFLKEFAGGLPWLHLDLSASTNDGGLGAVPTSQTGFGAAWLVDWLESKSQPRRRRLGRQ